MLSVARDFRAGAGNQHGKDQTNGALPQDGHNIAGLRVDMLDALQTGIYRLDKAGLVEGNAIGDDLNSTLDNPIHHADVLGKSAAGRFIPRGDPDFFVYRALRVQFSGAVETFSARNVVENDDSIAGLRSAAHSRFPFSQSRPVDFVAENSCG